MGLIERLNKLSCRNHAIALLATTTVSPNFLLDASLVSPERGRLSCLFGDISPLPPMVSLESGRLIFMSWHEKVALERRKRIMSQHHSGASSEHHLHTYLHVLVPSCLLRMREIHHHVSPPICLIRDGQTHLMSQSHFNVPSTQNLRTYLHVFAPLWHAF